MIKGQEVSQIPLTIEIDEFGVSEQPFKEASAGKKIYYVLFNLIGWINLFALGHGIYTFGFDFLSVLEVFTELTILFLFARKKLMGKPFKFWYLDDKRLEYRGGILAHKKIWIDEIEYFKEVKEFGTRKLEVKIKGGRTLRLRIDIPLLDSFGRKKFKKLLKKLEETTSLLEGKRVQEQIDK